MAVISYEPLQNGAYRFTDDTGKKLMAFGSEADRLRASLDARNAGRTAQYDPAAPFGSVASVPPGPPPQRADVGPNMSVAPPQDAAVSVAPPAPAVETPPPGPQSTEATRPYQPPPIQGIPDYTGGRGQVIDPDTAAAYIMAPVRTPGRAALDPAKYDASQGLVRRAQTVTGAIAETEEQKAERIKEEQENRQALRAAIADQAAASEEGIASAEQRRTDAYNATIAADNERRAAETRRAEIENRYLARRAEIQKELDAANSMKADPDRIWKERGTGARVLSAIGIALGAYAATMRGGPNFALEIVNKAVDRDIESQMDEIRRKGAAANNALADLSRQHELSIDEAREVMRMAANNYIASRSEMVASQMGTADARQKAANMRMLALQKNAEHEAQLREMYQGRVSTQSQFMAPQAATGPGYRNPTEKEMEARGKVVGVLSALGGGGMTPSEKLNYQQDEMNRRVRLVDGRTLWATNKDRADKAKTVFEGSAQLTKNIDRQLEILSKTGDSLSPELREEYNALAEANNVFLTKNIEFPGEAMSDGERALIKPITGEGRQEIVSIFSNAQKGAQTIKQHLGFRMRQAETSLYKDPGATVPANDDEASAGIKEGR